MFGFRRYFIKVLKMFIITSKIRILVASYPHHFLVLPVTFALFLLWPYMILPLCGLNLHFSLGNDFEYIFKYLCTIKNIEPFMKDLLVFGHFLNCIVFLLLIYMRFLYSR